MRQNVSCFIGKRGTFQNALQKYIRSAQGQNLAVWILAGLNFAVDFWVDFFVMFFPKESGQKNTKKLSEKFSEKVSASVRNASEMHQKCFLFYWEKRNVSKCVSEMRRKCAEHP